jgi:hypothetical protein
MYINIQSAVLEALAKNEETLSRLYKKYSLQFSAYSKFWSGLSFKEISHAKQIRMFYLKIREGSADFEVGRFELGPIKLFSRYLNKLILKEEETLINAFAVAIDIEEALIEKEFFRVFRADSEQLKRLLSRLAADTKEHRRLIKAEFKRFKASLS